MYSNALACSVFGVQACFRCKFVRSYSLSQLGFTMNCGPQQEIPLTGGRTTSGITRIGDTVRRPLSETSAFVQPLLQHLKEVGFNGAPRFLGIDDKSREILSYFPGTVPSDIRWFSDSQLEAAAKLIQRYHNATVNLASAYHTEVICHHDLSPCNFVFAGTLPYAIIDFDAAAPGSRSADLSYAAWLWLDIGNPDIAPQEQKRRLVFFARRMECLSINTL